MDISGLLHSSRIVIIHLHVQILNLRQIIELKQGCTALFLQGVTLGLVTLFSDRNLYLRRKCVFLVVFTETIGKGNFSDKGLEMLK